MWAARKVVRSASKMAAVRAEPTAVQLDYVMAASRAVQSVALLDDLKAGA